MLSYQVEPWDRIKHEVWPLWQAHYDEIAADKDRIPLDPDWDRYQAHADAGRLHILAARKRGGLVGYVFAIVDTHLHYRGTLFGFFDIDYLRPDCRKGWAGVRLIKEADKSLKARGVVKITGAVKLWADHGTIYKRLGWRETERMFTKWIGG